MPVLYFAGSRVMPVLYFADSRVMPVLYFAESRVMPVPYFVRVSQTVKRNSPENPSVLGAALSV